jgi:hypothetical protein
MKNAMLLIVLVSLSAYGCGGLDSASVQSGPESQANASIQTASACAPGQTFVASARVYPGNQLVTNVCVTVTSGGSCFGGGHYTAAAGLDFCTPLNGGSSFPRDLRGQLESLRHRGIRHLRIRRSLRLRRPLPRWQLLSPDRHLQERRPLRGLGRRQGEVRVFK